MYSSQVICIRLFLNGKTIVPLTLTIKLSLRGISIGLEMSSVTRHHRSLWSVSKRAVFCNQWGFSPFSPMLAVWFGFHLSLVWRLAMVNSELHLYILPCTCTPSMLALRASHNVGQICSSLRWSCKLSLWYSLCEWRLFSYTHLVSLNLGTF